jgi:hypothetical protein
MEKASPRGSLVPASRETAEDDDDDEDEKDSKTFSISSLCENLRHLWLKIPPPNLPQ